jgi:hypothetical protein
MANKNPKSKLMKFSKEVLAEYILRQSIFVDFEMMNYVKQDVEFDKILEEQRRIADLKKPLLEKLRERNYSTIEDAAKLLIELKQLDDRYAKLDKKVDKILK